jgi:hypothetical protein
VWSVVLAGEVLQTVAGGAGSETLEWMEGIEVNGSPADKVSADGRQHKIQKIGDVQSSWYL